MNSDLRYSLYAVGIWVSFLLFGYCQESLTRREFDGQRFEFPLALVVCQSFLNVLVAGSIILYQRTGFSAGVPAQHWVVCASGYYGAHWFGLASLQHIIYPLQVVIKSCKAVPVMIGEVLIARSRPSWAKVLAVLQLSLGAGLFMYFSDKGHGQSAISENLWYGVLLACGALVCDAVYGPYQTRICQEWKPTAWHLMFQMNHFQLLFALITCCSGTQLEDAYAMVMAHLETIGVRLLLFCASMTLGNVFIYQMQREFGALAVAKTTTVRKLVSVALSVVLFGHSLNILQYLAMATVFSAPLIEQRLESMMIPKDAAKSASPKRKASPKRSPRKAKDQ
jgi:solute carrier family 35 (UDP-galactose transporter), member B1